MAYQNDYKKLLEDIQTSGQGWSAYDLDLAKKNPDAGRSIYTQKQAHAGAATAEEKQAAHDAAELIRQRYGGYSGGKYGAGYTLSDAYAPQREAYTPKYQDQIEDLLSDIQDRKPFSYSPGADPSYQAYAEKYRNLGRKSAADALGGAAAMTGGIPSSYAVTASQQAQDSYNAQLSDAIPQLQQLAYQMYLGDLDQQRNDLSALMSLDQQDYSRYADSRNDALTQWQLNYGVDRDKLGDQSQRSGDAFDRALAKWQLTGTLDGESAKVLGLPAGTKTTDYEALTAQRASSGGSGMGGGKKPKLTLAQAQKAAEGGQVNQNVIDAIDYYLGSGAYEQFYGDGGDYQLTNRNGNGWVFIQGLGRFTYDELQSMVDEGRVDEEIDRKNGTITYSKA